MNKKITSSALAALMIAGSTSFSALAAMSNGTVVIGTKAFDMAYANDVKNAEEIGNAIVAMTAGQAVYVKDFDGNWVENTTGKTVAASVIPAVVYKNATGVVSNFAAADKDATTNATAVTISAINAKSFKATFNGSPADTSKVVFTVQRSTTPVVVTTTWNEAKTEATLTAASNLPEGEYTVAVKNDTVDLGTSKITIAQQKIAKINITSNKLAVSGVFGGTTGNAQKGYATYNVMDQYGNDITSSYISNNVQFQTGVGSIQAKNGVLTITPNTNLIQFANVVITGFDSTNGASTSATLTTSTALGTLSDIKLSALTNVDNKVLTAGDTTSIYYITYEAIDISGNVTKDYNLVKSGLILQGTDFDELSSSNPYVKAKIVHDPIDSSKAAIQVTVSNTDAIAMDQPLSITAMSYSGKTSSLNLTLKKAAIVSTFKIMAPAFDIAVGETKEIPFTAYDQNGVQVKRYADLNGKVTLNGGLSFEKNVDGTARLMVKAAPFKGPQMLSTMVGTDLSNLTLNIQDVANAGSLGVDSTVVVTAMQENATQNIDFGYAYGGLSLKDQYGRSMDMTTADSSNTYKVLAESNSLSKVTVSGFAAAGKNGIAITSIAPGTATVTFKLVKTTDETKVLDSKTVTFSVIRNEDINDYMVEAVEKPIYTSAKSVTAPTERDYAYYANPYVYGKTSSGAKVLLGAASQITGAYVDNTTDFAVRNTADYDSVEVVAAKFADYTKTASSTNLTVIIKAYDNTTKTAMTTIKSTTVAPQVTTVAASVDTSLPGITKDGDIITVDLSKTNKVVTGNYITRFNNATGAKVTRSAFHLYVKDSYDTKAMALAQIKKEGTSTVSDAGFTVDTVGMITVNGASIKNGDYADITAVAATGAMKTVRVIFTKSAISAEETAVIAAKEALTLGTTTAVTSNLTLPLVQGAATVTWATDNAAVITNAGVVTRQAADTTVKLTATLKVGTATAVKEFTAVVKAKDVVGVNDLVGTFETKFGFSFAKVTVPTGKTVSKIMVNSKDFAAENYSVKGTALTIADVLDTDAIKIIMTDNTEYTVKK